MRLAPRNFMLGLVISLLASFGAAQVPQFPAFAADVQITNTVGTGSPTEVNGKIFVGSGHMRVDVMRDGHRTAAITDFATDTVDMLMVDQKMYVEHKGGQVVRGTPNPQPAVGLKSYDPVNPCSNDLSLTCKKIGVETVSDRPCDHWQITDKSGKVFNIWIAQKLHFPLKIASEGSTTVLSNVKEGQPNPSIFRIPPDYEKLNAQTPSGPTKKSPAKK